MKTINKIYTSNINIKKSEFICRLFPIKNENEAKEIINEISTKYNDATHNCTAYRIGNHGIYDDNGEPSGTAGKPILNVLEKNDLSNILAIVTRYFGGIKLGAGGLVRAYSKSVLNTLEEATIVQMSEFQIYELNFPYNHIKNIDNEIRNQNIRIISKDYDENVKYTIALKNKEPTENIEQKYDNVELEFITNQYLEE